MIQKDINEFKYKRNKIKYIIIIVTVLLISIIQILPLHDVVIMICDVLLILVSILVFNMQEVNLCDSYTKDYMDECNTLAVYGFFSELVRTYPSRPSVVCGYMHALFLNDKVSEMEAAIIKYNKSYARRYEYKRMKSKVGDNQSREDAFLYLYHKDKALLRKRYEKNDSKEIDYYLDKLEVEYALFYNDYKMGFDLLERMSPISRFQNVICAYYKAICLVGLQRESEVTEQLQYIIDNGNTMYQVQYAMELLENM